MDSKKCSKCAIIKLSDQFWKKKSHKSGLSSECKECGLKIIKEKKNHNPNYRGSKKCTKCNVIKHKKEFYKSAQNKDGLYSFCSLCLELKRLEYRYGLSEKQLKHLKSKQKNKCALCDKNKKLVVDHCHLSNKIRGLLCTTCNLALGKLGDTEESIQKVLRYLS